jgi:tRNA A-37 threonylcarbamoyl transferase component Bud32
VQLIGSACVRTPNLLWSAKLLDGNGQILAFEYIDGADSLQDRWDAASADEERVDVLTRAMIIIAKLHNHGIVQTDIHLGNFLMSDRRVYTIDGGGIVRRSESPLIESLSIENLSWFFAQYFPRFDEFSEIVLPVYETVRGWTANPDRVDSLSRQIVRSRESRKKHYMSKIFRDCTRLVCRSDNTRFMVCERSEYDTEMRQLLENPDKFIAEGQVLKNGNTATVALVHLSNRSLVVKRYNIKNGWHGLTRAFQRSRASISWFNAFHMEFLGIKSLKPIALLEHRIGPMRREAYFITEHIAGPDALKFLKQAKNTNGEPEALARLLISLSDSNISHGDLKATNFVMSEQGAVLIDLDAMKEHRSQQGFKLAFSRDLQRFLKNWHEYPLLNAQFSELLHDLSVQYNVKS